MVRTFPRPAKKRHHGSIQSRRRPPPPRVNHPAGRQKRGAPDPLCHAPDPRTGHRAQHPPDPRCHAAHRAAPGNGRRSGPSVGRHLFIPRAGDRLRLPAHGRLPPPLRAPARLGDAHRPDVGPLRRGLHSQAGRRQDRTPAPRHPLPRFPEARCEVQLRCRRRFLHGRGPGVEGHLHAPRRGLRNGHGQHHHGRRAGPGHDHNLQRRLRTLRAAALPHAQPHGRPHLGHRLEPADHRGRRVARRHGPHAAARHDRWAASSAWPP